MRPTTPKAIVSILLLSPTLGAAATIRVPEDFPTVQAGMDAASQGDTVELACGTYYEHDLVLRPGITLRSESGSATCARIDAQLLGRVMRCDSLSAPTILEGLTIARGGSNGGSGLYCIASDLTLRGCVFDNNYAWSHAGASGGGMVAQSSVITATDCVFRYNDANNNASAAGIYSSTASFTGCSFYHNTTGGGSASLAVVNGTLSVQDSYFRRSSLEMWSPDATIAGNLFFNAHLGVYSGSPVIRNSTFAKASIYLSGTASPTLQRSVVALGEHADPAVWCSSNWTGSITISCCNVYGNAGGDWTGCLAGHDGSDGNFSEDPLFCDLDAEDLHLQWASPCLPANSGDCGLIGALGFGGCNSVAVEPETWASIKSRYRSDRP